MKSIIFALVMSLSFLGCYTKGYVKVTKPSITDFRWNATQKMFPQAVGTTASPNGVYNVTLTLSNPETKPVTMHVACFPTYTGAADVTPFEKTVVVPARSDKNVNFLTMGSLSCQATVLE